MRQLLVYHVFVNNGPRILLLLSRVVSAVNILGKVMLRQLDDAVRSSLLGRQFPGLYQIPKNN